MNCTKPPRKGKRAFAITFVCVLVSVLVSEFAVAQPKPDILLMVDSDKFVQDDLTSFRKALLERATESGAIEAAKVMPNESLSQLVARVYGYGITAKERRFQKIQSDIMEAIVQLNRGLEPAKLISGQVLQIPQYLRRPLTKGSSSALAQVLNLSRPAPADVPSSPETSPAYTVSTTLGSAWTRRAAIVDGEVESETTTRDAGVSLLRIDPDLLSKLGGLGGLRQKVRDGTFALVPNTEQYLVGFSQVEADKPSVAPIAPAALLPMKTFELSSEQVKTVQMAGQGKLYLLDVFSTAGAAKCSHGDLVYEKAQQTLASLGLASEANRIEKLSIDFYSDRPTNTQFVKAWIQRSFKGRALENYNAGLATLTKTPTPTGLPPGSIVVPGLFLQAVYGTLADNAAALVVSGSFYTNSSDNIFPKDILLNEKASLINAVLNDASTIESKTQVFQEPLSTFNLYRDLLGTILVGYFDENGAPQGMYSEKGIGVTTIDDGIVTGRQGSCLGTKEAGASFAAPVVAVKVLVGRLLWNAQGKSVDAIAARGRLLRSASVRKAYVGKYWSAGAASPARLYAPTGRYLLGADGSMTDASNLAGRLKVTVEVALASGPKEVEYTFDTESGDPSLAFVSLLLDDDTAFLLERRPLQEPTWYERKIIKICFCSDDKKNLSLSEARKIFKEVVRNE